MSSPSAGLHGNDQSFVTEMLAAVLTSLVIERAVVPLTLTLSLNGPNSIPASIDAVIDCDIDAFVSSSLLEVRP